MQGKYSGNITWVDDTRFSRSSGEIEKELADIKAKAITDGTFMKAPNGKRSNLGERQWLHVRLKSFKDWFGDWENWFKKNFLLNGRPVATLTGEEFARVEGKSLTDQVEEYFNSIGNKAVSPLYGDVVLDRRGADDSLAHGMGRNKAVAYRAVKDVIENGILIDYHENHKNRGYDSAVISAPITIRNERYICSVVITRMEDNRFYLHEVIEQKRLSDEGSNTVQGQPQRPKTFANILQNILNASDVLTPHEASVFDEIINFFMQIMETLGIRLSNQQCKTIFVASAQAMREAKESRDKANTESKPNETKDQTESKTKDKSDKEVKEEETTEQKEAESEQEEQKEIKEDKKEIEDKPTEKQKKVENKEEQKKENKQETNTADKPKSEKRINETPSLVQQEKRKLFNERIKNQGVINGKVTSKKISLYDVVGKDPLKPALTGVYHDPTSLSAVASNGYILIIDNTSYDDNYRGQIIDKNGEAIEVKYPNYKILYNNGSPRVSSNNVDFKELLRFINGAKTKVKKGKKAQNENIDPFVHIGLRDNAGNVESYDVERLETLVRHAIRMGLDKLEFYNFVNDSYRLDAVGKNGRIVIVPTPTEFYHAYDLLDNGRARFSRFYNGMTHHELYEAIDEHSNYTSGVSELLNSLEKYYSGEIVSASGGARRAIENGLIPVTGNRHSGEAGEYHHIEFRAEDGETFVEAVPFVKAEDVADREMIRFKISRTAEEFEATQRQAVEEKGIVMPGLNNAIVNVVDVPRHDFTGTGKDALRKAEDWSNKNIIGEHIYHKGQEDEFKYTIDKDAIGKFLSKSSTTESDNLGVHLAVLKKLPEVIDNSIDVEIHPDYKKVDNKRSADNGVGNEDLLVHRMYGAVSIDGRIYRAKTTIHEFKNKDNRAYDYKITEVELIISGSSTSNALNSSTSVSATKILNGVEKSYDKGKKVLEKSKNNTRFSRKEEIETYANDLRFCAKKDLKTFPTLYKVAEKYWNDNKHKMSKMVNDAKSVDALVDLMDTLYNGLMEEYFLSKAEVNPNRVRHEIAQLKNTDPNTLRSILNAKGIDYKNNVDDYTNDELREIGSGISDVLTEKRRAVGEQWKEVLERENVPTRYLVLRSLLQYISKNKEAVPVNYLEGAFDKTMDRFNESANPISFNFYAEYNKSIAEVLFEDTDNVIEISREEGNGISGKWGRMKKQSESADVEETKAKVSAISYNTSWCTKQANVDGTGAKKVIEEDNHDFYVFVKDGETTGTMAIVPIREEEGEDVLKNNPWYTGIFKQSNGSDNSIDPEYFDVVNALARKAKDTDLVRTLDLMGYNGMTKEEMAELQRQKNAKQTEWFNSHDEITEADFADINDMFGILLHKNGDDVVLHELTQGIYEQPNEVIRDLFWEKVGGIINIIEGDVKIENDTQLTLPNLTSVGGVVRTYNNSQLTLPNVTSVGGSVVTNGNSQLTLPNLTSIGGSVATFSYQQLTLPSVTRIDGDVTTSEDSQLMLPSVTRIDGDVKTYDDSQLTLPNVTEIGGHVKTYDKTQLTLPNLTSVGGYVETHGNSQLTLPNVTSVGYGVETKGNSQLTLPNLTSIGWDVRTHGNSQLTLPNVISIGADVKTFDNSQLTLPNVTSVGGHVETYNYAQLTLPNVTEIDGWVITTDDSHLTLPSSMQGKFKGNITWVDNTRFSVSRDNNLIAIHNLSEYNMRRVIDMGALVMPSIAITNTKIGHTSFGDISLLFGKDTIDPSDRRNKVYGGDAWTPRFPHLEPKINESVVKDFKKKIYDLLSDTRLRDLYNISSEVNEDIISDNIRNGGVERYYNKEFMKHAYLLDKGKKVKVPTKPYDYGEYADVVIDLAKARGVNLSDINNGGFDFYKNNEDFVNELNERIIDNKVSSLNIPEEEKEKVRGLLRKDGMGFGKFDRLVRQASVKERDLKYGLKEVVDRKALFDDVNSRVNSNNANYRKWVNDLFDGIIEKYGIRNNKDWYTPSGTQRSWNELYDNVTPSNILKHMLSESQQGGQGFFNSSIFGASAEEYGSIEEIRERGKERLQKEDKEVYEEWNNSVFNRLSDIRREVVSSDSSFGDSMDFNQEIINAVSKKKIASGIYKEVKRFYPKFTMSHAKQVEDIVKEIQAHAIGYFEAKPQRIISLNEVVKAVVPTGTSADIIDGLKGYGVEVVTYRRGNDNAHKRAVERASRDIRFSKNNANQEVFVSNAERAVEGIKQDKATPEQWLKMIEKQGGLKAGEDKWLGLSDWLKGQDKKSITKQEILDFIGENKIQIEEVSYGNDGLRRLQGEFDQLLASNGGDSDSAFEEMIDRYGEDFGMAIYVDGTTLSVADGFEDYLELFSESRAIDSIRLNYTTKGLDNKREIALTVPTIESWNEGDDVHFGDAGGGRAVAWIRFGETTDSDDNRVLVIDEIQSKRHQEGREKGYQKNAIKEKQAFEKAKEELESHTKFIEDKYGENGLFKYDYGLRDIDVTDAEKYRTLSREYENALKAYNLQRYGIPEAPFEKNWHELAMKRILRLAAEEGYDKVAWTKGEQQAERYDIGNVVNGIDANPPDADFEYTQVLIYNDGVTLEMDVDKDGKIVKGHESASQEYEGKNLSEVVGKENAIKLLTGEEVKLRGENFRLGGEGMKGFYDEILPRFMNRYGKKWGTKVEDVELPNVEEAGRVMHSVDVTEEMRESVMEGQVMFSKKRTAPETVSVHDEHLQTVVSSAVGAKVLNNIDDAIKEYGNHTLTKEKTFLGNLAKILNAKRDGSNSEYATFEAVNGKVFTIRLSDHNATVSNFDVRDEDRGISIVITAKDNKGITNDGDAHVTEYFYDAIKLRKADGKPLVEILKSVKQALYSGEYKDNTGLAEVREVNNTNGIDDTRFSRKMGEVKAQLADMKYGETVRMDALADAKRMFLQGE